MDNTAVEISTILNDDKIKLLEEIAIFAAGRAEVYTDIYICTGKFEDEEDEGKWGSEAFVVVLYMYSIAVKWTVRLSCVEFDFDIGVMLIFQNIRLV